VLNFGPPSDPTHEKREPLSQGTLARAEPWTLQIAHSHARIRPLRFHPIATQ